MNGKGLGSRMFNTHDSRRVVVFDFDGVIHSYASGWQGEYVANDLPNEDVVQAIKDLRADGYSVIIMSCRCNNRIGESVIMAYLEKYGIEVDGITNEKVGAVCYIDDRAVCYRPGVDLVTTVKNFKPWVE